MRSPPLYGHANSDEKRPRCPTISAHHGGEFNEFRAAGRFEAVQQSAKRESDPGPQSTSLRRSGGGRRVLRTVRFEKVLEQVNPGLPHGPSTDTGDGLGWKPWRCWRDRSCCWRTRRALREIDRNSHRMLPAFGIPAPHGQCTIPSRFCACGRARRSHDPDHDGVSDRFWSSFDESREVFDRYMPHCDQHEDGADIGSVSRRPAKNDTNAIFSNEYESLLAIRVKSYAFYLDFMRLNGYPHFYQD
jgi:hypothetical protein